MDGGAGHRENEVVEDFCGTKLCKEPPPTLKKVMLEHVCTISTPFNNAKI